MTVMTSQARRWTTSLAVRSIGVRYRGATRVRAPCPRDTSPRLADGSPPVVQLTLATQFTPRSFRSTWVRAAARDREDGSAVACRRPALLMPSCVGAAIVAGACARLQLRAPRRGDPGSSSTLPMQRVSALTEKALALPRPFQAAVPPGTDEAHGRAVRRRRSDPRPRRLEWNRRQSLRSDDLYAHSSAWPL
jgi:hypothetical protein